MFKCNRSQKFKLQLILNFEKRKCAKRIELCRLVQIVYNNTDAIAISVGLTIQPKCNLAIMRILLNGNGL